MDQSQFPGRELSPGFPVGHAPLAQLVPKRSDAMLSQEVAFIHTAPTAAITSPVYTGLLGIAKGQGNKLVEWSL